METHNFTIHFSLAAAEDLDRVFTYISEHFFAPATAHDLMEKIEKSILRLREYPLSGSECEDRIISGKGYRKLIVDNYIVFHLVDEIHRRVIIARVLYGPMDYGRLL